MLRGGPRTTVGPRLAPAPSLTAQDAIDCDSEFLSGFQIPGVSGALFILGVCCGSQTALLLHMNASF